MRVLDRPDTSAGAAADGGDDVAPSAPRRARTALAVVVLAAWTWGIAAGLWTPRGPLSSFEGLTAIAISLGLGGVAGVLLKTRWAMLVAPVAFVVAFELTRSGADGPTVDGIHFSTYGLVAFASGRGVHGLLALVPMALGAALGAAWVRRSARTALAELHGRARAGLLARRAATWLVGAGLVLLAVAIARPASTDPILGPDGEPVPGSVAELDEVTIGGRDLDLMIRGRSVENPVLLFLAGGPGGSELGAMRRHLEALEDDFVVVTWDQRGSGKSYDDLDPAETLTLDGAVGDTIEVADHLRTRFGDDRIHLMGQSYGSVVGVLAAREAPGRFEAFIGTGQMVSPAETDRLFYEDTLAWARRAGEEGVVDELTDLGPPPYERILDYEPALAHEHDVYPYDRTGASEGEGGFSENLFVEEYTLLESLHAMGAFLDVFASLYPQLQDVDLREDAPSLAIPVYLVQGRHEARGRTEPADEWYAGLDAPEKERVVLDGAGHRPLWERPGEFVGVMREVVLGR